MSMFCLASIYRQREISYKSVSDIPVCPRLAAKVYMAGMVMATPIFMYFTSPCSHTSKGLPISDLVEPYSLVSTGIVLLAFSLKDKSV